MHRADAVQTDLNMAGLNLGSLIEAFGCAAGTVMPKSRRPLMEVQQNNSLLSGIMPDASRTMWSQTEPWAGSDIKKEWCDGVRFSSL